MSEDVDAKLNFFIIGERGKLYRLPSQDLIDSVCNFDLENITKAPNFKDVLVNIEKHYLLKGTPWKSDSPPERVVIGSSEYDCDLPDEVSAIYLVPAGKNTELPDITLFPTLRKTDSNPIIDWQILLMLEKTDPKDGAIKVEKQLCINGKGEFLYESRYLIFPAEDIQIDLQGKKGETRHFDTVTIAAVAEPNNRRSTTLFLRQDSGGTIGYPFRLIEFNGQLNSKDGEIELWEDTWQRCGGNCSSSSYRTLRDLTFEASRVLFGEKIKDVTPDVDPVTQLFGTNYPEQKSQEESV